MSTLALSSLAKYQLRPATLADMHWTIARAAQVYQGADVIPAETMLAWFAANPTGFSVVWYEGQRVGSYDILPLKPTYLHQLVAGTLLERDLPGDSLYRPAEVASIRALYWESVVKTPAYSGAGDSLLDVLIYNYRAVLERLCPLAQIDHLYALGASERGAGVLRRVGLSPVGDPAQRLDKHQLYHGTLPQVAAAVAQLVGQRPELGRAARSPHAQP